MTDPTPQATEHLTVEALYKAHSGFVARFVMGMGIAHDDVPDLVQEVFIVVHRHGGFVLGRAKPTTWLAEIAFRLASDRRKRRDYRRRNAYSTSVALAPTTTAMPCSRAEARQSLARVQRALDVLTPEKRAVFVLYELEGQSCDTIAEALAIRVGTVYSRLHCARREVAEHHRKSSKEPALRRIAAVAAMKADLSGSAVLALEGVGFTMPVIAQTAAATSSGGTAIVLATLGAALAAVLVLVTSDGFAQDSGDEIRIEAEPVKLAGLAPDVSTDLAPRLAPVVDTTVEHAPAVDVQLAAQALPEPTPAAATPRNTARKKRKRPTKAQPTASDQYLREAELVSRARHKLRSDPAQTLALTKEGARDFPRGVLVMEREALAVSALQRLGRNAAATVRGERFLKRYAQGPHADAVRLALEKAGASQG